MVQTSIRQSNFGHLPDGTEVTRYTITNRNGMELQVMDYGCTITSLKVPDRTGVMADIVLGYDALQGYLDSAHYMGCIIGRCAGRIANGKWDMDGHPYQLAINQPPHHLHGGVKGFDKVIWRALPVENEHGVGLDFMYISPDGEEGYPGNLAVHVRYFLSHENALMMHYVGQTDQPTIINLTQHSYFNLNGGNETVLKHALAIYADQYLPVDRSKIPSGQIDPVEGTVFDFRNPALVAQIFLHPDEQVRMCHGLDHCWVLQREGDELAHAATLFHPGSGRLMDVYTTEPGLQVYTANTLEGKGKNDNEYGPYSGICLETQHFPDAPHHPHFPSILKQPGHNYISTTILHFSAIDQ